jgi:hypothetical protein
MILALGGVVIIVIISVIVGLLLAGEADYHVPPRARRRGLGSPEGILRIA